MPTDMTENSPERIAKHYSACMDSVNLINKGKPAYMTESEWDDTVSRNKRHLQLMIAKPFWTTEDLTAITLAAQ